MQLRTWLHVARFVKHFVFARALKGFLVSNETGVKLDGGLGLFMPRVNDSHARDEVVELNVLQTCHEIVLILSIGVLLAQVEDGYDVPVSHHEVGLEGQNVSE